jgi:hypothetical protein
MTTEELKILQICKDRNELDFLYNITKIIAETDSISEGWSYCDDYSKNTFDAEMLDLKGDLIREDDHLLYAGLPIYMLYLKQIKIINDETIY